MLLGTTPSFHFVLEKTTEAFASPFTPRVFWLTFTSTLPRVVGSAMLGFRPSATIRLGLLASFFQRHIRLRHRFLLPWQSLESIGIFGVRWFLIGVIVVCFNQVCGNRRFIPLSKIGTFFNKRTIRKSEV